MYPNRPSNKPVMITGIVMAAVVAGLFTLNFVMKKPKAPVETEAAKHSVLIYKSSDGIIEYDKKLFSKEDDEKLMLSVTPQEMVALVVHPDEGKYFDDVSINATNDISTSYSYLVNDADDDNKRINFVMPDEDVLVNLKFSDEEKKPEEQKVPEPSTEPETMMETPETNPYNLTIHGLTASILQSYSGQFDDQKFLQQLGDQLHISSAMSEYQGVTDVTFSEEEYKGEQDEDQVYHYIYFNNDPRWEALAVYDARNISISSVPEELLNYLDNRYIFQYSLYDYLFSHGKKEVQSAEVTDYSIDAGTRQATIKLKLSDGSGVTAVYSKSSGSYTFS